MTQLEKDREAFKALYWDQRAGCFDLVKEIDNNVGIHTIVGVDYYLSLYSLEDITDEDAKEVVSIIMSLGLQSTAMRYPKEYVLNNRSSVFKFSGAVDFLRSRSYLVPYRGYSVEQIISMGWAKIKER